MRARRRSRASLVSVRRQSGPQQADRVGLRTSVESLEERRLLAFMVGEYRFDEGAGTTAHDTAGVTRAHGTLVGGASWTTGQFGSALDLDGTGRVSFEQSWANYLAHQGTVSAWIRTTQVGGATADQSPGILGSNNPDGSDDNYWGWIDDTGRIGIQFGDTPGAKSPMPINDGQWHHVALTRDRFSAEVQVFVDGVKVASAVSADGVRHAPIMNLGAITASPQDNKYAFRGSIDELRIDADVLSDSEIARLATRPGTVAKPTTPQNFTAHQIRPDAIEMTWTANPARADGIEIEFSTTGPTGPYYLHQKTNYDYGLGYFGDVEPGGTYHFRIRACNLAGCSAYTAAVPVAIAPEPAGHVGDGIGLSARYFDNMNFTGPSVSRIDPTVDFDLGIGSPHPAIQPEEFSAVWTGQVQAQFSEAYQFVTRSDDGVRLYLNGQLIINNWTDHGPVTDRSAPLELVAGQKYGIRMEWYERIGGATAQLMWASPSTQEKIIPQAQLYPGPGTGDGLLVTIAGHSGTLEGQDVRLAASASGGQGPYTFTWSTRLNGEPDFTGQGATFFRTIPDDGIYEITFTATDAAGQTGSAKWIVNAGEVEPTLYATAPGVVNEGEEFEITLQRSDAPFDEPEWWHVDWGDGTDPDGDGQVGEFAYGGTATAKHAYADEGDYTIIYSMKDKEGVHFPAQGDRYRLTDVMGTWHEAEAEAVSLGGHLVAINSAAEHQALIEMFLRDNPTAAAYWIGLTDADEYTTEGNYVWTSDEPLTYADWNTETGEPNNYNGPGSEDYVAMNFQTWFGHPGHLGSWNDMTAFQFPFRGIVELETSEPLVVTVLDTEPDAELDVDIIRVPSPALEGTPYSIGATVNGVHGVIGTYAWVVRNGDRVVATSSERELLFTAPDNGTYTVSLHFTRADGDDEGAGSATFTVENRAPQVEPIGGAGSAVRNQAIEFMASFEDAALDTNEVSWDFGDGVVTPFQAATVGSVSATHIYLATGSYTVKLHVRDDEGAVTTVTKTVTVKATDVQPDPCDEDVQALVVGGTAANDVIKVSLGNGKNKELVVTVNGRRVGAIPSEPKTGDPTKLMIFAGSGNDVVSLSGNVDLPLEVYGGDGNDVIHGGSGADILVGGSGTDVISGGNGRDLLIGGTGRDNLNGQQDEDILIGESTAHDSDREALCLILKEWTRPDQNAPQRREHISSGGGVNGSFVFNVTTVINDAQQDNLNGYNDDWSFEHPRTAKATATVRRTVTRRRSIR